MRKLPLLIVAIATVLGTVGVAFASDYNFRTHLKGSQEVPAVVTNGQGQVMFKIADDEQSVDFKLNVTNIDGVTQSHIHCGTPELNGPVVVFLYGFNATGVSPHGTLSEGTFTNANVIPRPASAACPTGVNNLADVISILRDGGAYVNVHTIEHPGGEIRGQVH